MEFKELTKKDAQLRLSVELDKLRRTGGMAQAEADRVDKEFDAYKRLFAKYLTLDASSSIAWEKIEKLPRDAVSIWKSTLPSNFAFTKI